MGKRYSFTQPCCRECWVYQYPLLDPIVLLERDRESEQCVFCGKQNFDGIYTRIHPEDAPYPTLLK